MSRPILADEGGDSMDVRQLLTEGFGRLPDLVDEAVRGLSTDELTWAPAPGGNTIGWLVWHLTRVQDHHISELLASDQVWVEGDWAARFGLASDPRNSGYGHNAAQVAAVRPDSAHTLVEYYESVATRTMALLGELTPAALDKVVDRRWDPPVTLGVRLVSVLADDLEHVGQAAYVRGLLPRG
jgi:uncharacterized damage-inducible protein DinB